MKKLLALLLVFLMLTTTIVGCSKSEKGNEKPVSSEETVDDSEFEDDEYVEDDEEYTEEDEEEYYEDDYSDYGDDYSDYDDDPGDLPLDEEEEDTAPLTPEEKRLEAMLLGEDKELNEDAIYDEGNLTRLAKAVKKSKGGKTATLVFYGNSVNTGLAGEVETAEVAYSQLVKEWWEENVGPCKVITSGLENLTSINACMRVDFDVLQYKPDVVFLDFAVQDAIGGMGNTNAIGYDNLIRRILGSKTAPAVVTLLLTGAEQTTYTMNPKNASVFVSASKSHKKVSQHYDLPILDFETSAWDNFTEIVKVTTKTEIPLVSWDIIGMNNITMNDDGHAILAGVIKNFLNKSVLKKLNKISTKDPSYPTEGLYGIDKYMKGSFITVGDIIEEKSFQQKGYAFDLNEQGMREYSYSYKSRQAGDTKSTSPCISTYRHFVIEDPANQKDIDSEENPYYLALNIPEVPTGSDIYFMVHSSYMVSTKGIAFDKILKYAPIGFYCYDKDGKLLNEKSLKVAAGATDETTTNGRTTAYKLPVGTTKIEFRIFTRGGIVRLLGIGEFK